MERNQFYFVFFKGLLLLASILFSSVNLQAQESKMRVDLKEVEIKEQKRMYKELGFHKQFHIAVYTSGTTRGGEEMALLLRPQDKEYLIRELYFRIDLKEPTDYRLKAYLRKIDSNGLPGDILYEKAFLMKDHWLRNRIAINTSDTFIRFPKEGVFLCLKNDEKFEDYHRISPILMTVRPQDTLGFQYNVKDEKWSHYRLEDQIWNPKFGMKLLEY